MFCWRERVRLLGRSGRPYILAPELRGGTGADEGSVSVSRSRQQLAMMSNHASLSDGDEGEQDHVLSGRRGRRESGSRGDR